MPALINSFLFIEPQKHYLEYGSLPLHDIVTQNKRAGQTITELIGDDANPDKIKQELTKTNSIVFAGIGHGNSGIYTVECTTPLLHAESPEELVLMKSRITSLCSCLTAQVLGPALIDAGALVYTGYKEEFWFYIGDAPNSTRAVQSPFLAEFKFVASLLNGRSTGDARSDQLARYDEEISFWTVGDGKDNADAMELSRILEMNKSNSVFLGEGAVSPSPRPTILTSSFLSPQIVFAVPAFLVVYMAYKELRKA